MLLLGEIFFVASIHPHMVTIYSLITNLFPFSPISITQPSLKPTLFISNPQALHLWKEDPQRTKRAACNLWKRWKCFFWFSSDPDRARPTVTREAGRQRWQSATRYEYRHNRRRNPRNSLCFWQRLNALTLWISLRNSSIKPLSPTICPRPSPQITLLPWLSPIARVKRVRKGVNDGLRFL
jgi:hypothetical protein